MELRCGFEQVCLFGSEFYRVFFISKFYTFFFFLSFNVSIIRFQPRITHRTLVALQSFSPLPSKSAGVCVKGGNLSPD